MHGLANRDHAEPILRRRLRRERELFDQLPEDGGRCAAVLQFEDQTVRHRRHRQHVGLDEKTGRRASGMRLKVGVERQADLFSVAHDAPRHPEYATWQTGCSRLAVTRRWNQ